MDFGQDLALGWPQKLKKRKERLDLRRQRADTEISEISVAHIKYDAVQAFALRIAFYI